MKKSFFYFVVVFALGVVATFAWQRYQSENPHADLPALKTTVANTSSSPSTIALPNFAEIVERVGPAVVHISVESKLSARQRQSPFGNIDPDDPFYEFFKRFMPNHPPQDRIVRGMGSGFIVSADGYVYTNAHVVEGADKVTVKLTDQREFQAEVVGIDKPTDVALLKIDAADLPNVVIGDPAQVPVGEWVLAIGAPFGFENSVTAGIVSAKSRSLPDESYVPFIQTDVAINPGNSGGPLLNLKGEVIGVNSQIYSRSGGYQGLSFAIPIDVVNRVTEQLQKTGKVSRGYLGVGIQSLNQELAKSFGLDHVNGALVTSVEKGGAADKAGVQVSDIIIEFNGQKVRDAGALPPLVGAVTPGEEIEVVVWRDGDEKTLKITVGELRDDEAPIAAKPGKEQSLDDWGLAVRNLSDNELAEQGVERGVMITDVDGPAANAGLRTGDLVLAVNGREVGNVVELEKLLNDRKNTAALLIQRGQARLFVALTRGK